MNSMLIAPPPAIEERPEAEAPPVDTHPKHHVGRIVVGIIGVIALVAAGFLAGRRSMQPEIDDLEAANATAIADNQELVAEIDDVTAEMGVIREQSATLEDARDDLMAQVDDLQSSLADAGQRFEATAVCRDAVDTGEELIALWSLQLFNVDAWWPTAVGSEEEAFWQQEIDDTFAQIDTLTPEFTNLRAECRLVVADSSVTFGG